MNVSDILDKKWFGGLYHLYNTQDSWDQWLNEFEPAYQYDVYVDEKLRKIFANNQPQVKDRFVVDLACNLGYLSLAASNLGAKKVLGLEVRQEFIDTFDKIRMHWPLDNISLLKCNIEDIECLRPYLADVDTIIYAGHFYHTINHVSILTAISDSNASCLILESTLIDNHDGQDFSYGLEDTVYALNGFLDERTQFYKVGAPSLEKTQELLVNLGWSINSIEIIHSSQPNRFVITSTRNTQ